MFLGGARSRSCRCAGRPGPSARRVPSRAAFLMRKSSGSMASRSQISSTTVSAAKAALVAPGAPVRGRGRLVDDDIVAVNDDIGDVITSKDAHGSRRRPASRGRRRPRRRDSLARDEPAARVRAQLDADERAGRGTGPFKDLRPVHQHLDRAAGRAAEQGGDRFEVNADLAAEAAADLHRHDLDARDRQSAAAPPAGHAP